jgi:CRP/FNR family transcriptional regulator, cyclic AMP receptor protein
MESSEMLEKRCNIKLLTEIGIPGRSFKAGETIFREGAAGEEAFVIKNGRVNISVDGRDLDQLGEKELFGEMALVDKNPRAATAVAATDVELTPIGEKQFLYLVDETPFFALTVMRIMAERLRRQNKSGA